MGLCRGHMIVVVASYAVGHLDKFAGAVFSSVKNEYRSNLALCWALLCDGAGTQGTTAEELQHSRR